MSDRNINYSIVIMTLIDFLSKSPQSAYSADQLANILGLSSEVIAQTLQGMQSSGMVRIDWYNGTYFYGFNYRNPDARSFATLFDVPTIRGIVQGVRWKL